MHVWLSLRGKGKSCLMKLLGGLSYKRFRRYNNSPPYVTARWLPQLIPPLNFLVCISYKLSELNKRIFSNTKPKSWSTKYKILLENPMTKRCGMVLSEKGPRYWNVPVLANTVTFLTYQYWPILVYLHGLEHESIILKLTILKQEYGPVLSNTRFPISGRWCILFPSILLYHTLDEWVGPKTHPLPACTYEVVYWFPVPWF